MSADRREDPPVPCCEWCGDELTPVECEYYGRYCNACVRQLEDLERDD